MTPYVQVCTAVQSTETEYKRVSFRGQARGGMGNCLIHRYRILDLQEWVVKTYGDDGCLMNVFKSHANRCDGMCL